MKKIWSFRVRILTVVLCIHFVSNRAWAEEKNPCLDFFEGKGRLTEVQIAECFDAFFEESPSVEKWNRIMKLQKVSARSRYFAYFVQAASIARDEGRLNELILPSPSLFSFKKKRFFLDLRKHFQTALDPYEEFSELNRLLSQGARLFPKSTLAGLSRRLVETRLNRWIAKVIALFEGRSGPTGKDAADLKKELGALQRIKAVTPEALESLRETIKRLCAGDSSILNRLRGDKLEKMIPEKMIEWVRVSVVPAPYRNAMDQLLKRLEAQALNRTWDQSRDELRQEFTSGDCVAKEIKELRSLVNLFGAHPYCDFQLRPSVEEDRITLLENMIRMDLSFRGRILNDFKFIQEKWSDLLQPFESRSNLLRYLQKVREDLVEKEFGLRVESLIQQIRKLPEGTERLEALDKELVHLKSEIQKPIYKAGVKRIKEAVDVGYRPLFDMALLHENFSIYQAQDWRRVQKDLSDLAAFLKNLKNCSVCFNHFKKPSGQPEILINRLIKNFNLFNANGAEHSLAASIQSEVSDLAEIFGILLPEAVFVIPPLVEKLVQNLGAYVDETSKSLDEAKSAKPFYSDLLTREWVSAVIRARSGIRDSIRSKGFLNLYDTSAAHTGGYKNEQARLKIESSLLGFTESEYRKVAIADRPKYGYLSTRIAPHDEEIRATEDASFYGEDFYAFDLNRLRGRLSWTPGDSLGGIAESFDRTLKSWSWNSSLDKKWKAEAWDEHFIPWAHRGLMTLFLRPEDQQTLELPEPGTQTDARSLGTAQNHWNLRTKYIEIQYWGKLTLDEVESFAFSSSPPSDHLFKDFMQKYTAVYQVNGKRFYPAGERYRKDFHFGCNAFRQTRASPLKQVKSEFCRWRSQEVFYNSETKRIGMVEYLFPDGKGRARYRGPAKSVSSIWTSDARSEKTEVWQSFESLRDQGRLDEVLVLLPAWKIDQLQTLKDAHSHQLILGQKVSSDDLRLIVALSSDEDFISLYWQTFAGPENIQLRYLMTADLIRRLNFRTSIQNTDPLIRLFFQINESGHDLQKKKFSEFLKSELGKEDPWVVYNQSL